MQELVLISKSYFCCFELDIHFFIYLFIYLFIYYLLVFLFINLSISGFCSLTFRDPNLKEELHSVSLVVNENCN